MFSLASVAKDTAAWTIRLSIILLLGSGAFTQSPRVIAQTADADAGSVAISGGSEGDSQSGSNASAGSNQNDWVHAWMRKTDEARASQAHFVSPIVTTHVMLVQQYRFDMSWQQDFSDGTITSNYGASHGLEIIPTTRLEVGLFQPPYLAHQSPAASLKSSLCAIPVYRGFTRGLLNRLRCSRSASLGCVHQGRASTHQFSSRPDHRQMDLCLHTAMPYRPQ
jgi:hypothetical protein